MSSFLESQVREIIDRLNQLWNLYRQLRDKVGKIQQDVSMGGYPGGSGGGGGGSLIPGTVTTAITTGSYASPGTGQITRLDTGETGVQVYNPFGAAAAGLAVGKFGWFTLDTDGKIKLVTGDC